MLALGLFACEGGGVALASPGSGPEDPWREAAAVAGETSEARLVEHVLTLESAGAAPGQPGSRVAGTPGAWAAGDSIADVLRACGLEAERTPFVVASPFAGRAVIAENLHVRLGPARGPAVVFVAHADSRGAADPAHASATGWRWDRSPAPGADDDASGCAALLELACLLAPRAATFERALVFAFTGAEELAEPRSGFLANLGAEHLAEALADTAVGAISVDMLLRPRPWGSSFRLYGDGRAASAELVTALEHAAWLVAPGAELRVVLDPSFTWSDHGAFWARGAGGVLFIEDDFHHARYHRPSDRLAGDDGFYSSAQLADGARILAAAAVWLARAR